MRDVKIRYEKSEVTFSEYNEALLSLSSNNLAKVQAEASWLTAKAALEELLTIKLEEVK